MKNLILLKDIALRTYLELKQNENRKDLLPVVGRLFPAPLITFDEAYDTFIKEVANNSGMFDWWLNIQMQMITDVGENTGVWTELQDMFTSVVSSSLGDNKIQIGSEYWQKSSFRCALAIRIYVDSI